jgi:DNA polymerase I-like protein with 3'-5' exonuclease and polymerase domains
MRWPEDTIMDWTPPSPELQDIPAGSLVALDLETHDPMLKDKGPGWAFGEGYIVGVALAWGLEQIEVCRYYPLRHLSGNWQGDKGKFMRWLRHQLRREDLEWAFANASYDLGWLNVIPEGRINDVQVSAPLLNEHRFSYSLDALAKTELGEGKDESLMKEWAKMAGVKPSEVKAMMALMPSFAVGPYAEQDASVTWRLHKLQMERIRAEGLGGIYRLEMDLVPMLMDMRRSGVRVNVAKAEALREEILIEEREAARALKATTGMGITAWDIELQMRALRNEGFTNFPKTAKKKVDGLTAATLEALSGHDSKAGLIAGQILDLRRKNRQRVTFVERLVLEHQHKGRIHAQFNALKSDDGGTVSGRFSSQDPNLQQIPARDEQASRRIRGLIEAEDGEELASADYASQEPRLAIHWAVQGGSKLAQKMADEFCRNPRLDLHQKVADLMGVKRSYAKILNLAQMYGQGGGSLCLALGLPASPDSFVNDAGKEINYLAPGKEGKALLEKYDQIMPFMKRTAKNTEREAREEGYTTTILGRKCRVFHYPGGGDDARKMFNRRIQGSAADMIKKSMLDAWRAGHKLRMTVHDENVFSVSSEKEALQCVEIMNAAVQLVVPVVCDLAVGKTWGDMREVST